MKLITKRQQQADIPNRRQRTRHDETRETASSRHQFRRGQTLTGSSSKDISSSGENNATILSPRAHIHHLARTRRSLMARLTIIIIAALFVYLFVSQLLATVIVHVAGASVPLPLQTNYEQSMNEYLNKHPFERFYPSLDKTSLLGYLQLQYPEIKSLDVALTGNFGSGELLLTLRQPVVRWSINGANEFVDADGIVFAHNAYQTPAVEVIDKNGSLSGSDAVVTSHRFLSFVGAVVGDMRQRGYTVTQATIPLLTTRQLEIQIASVSYVARLSVDRSAGEQTEDISRIIPFLASKSITPQYVDVRVKGKAFYK